jgi:hypothetical protein
LPEQVEGSLVDRPDILRELAGKPLDKVIGQQRNVVAPLAERRQRDREDVQR